MALPDPSSTTETPRPSILVIEDYDALAAAICSALKKFAPQHRCLAVASLREVKLDEPGDAPDLIIIDVDPAPEGLVQFLERGRTAWPNARLLVIGCGTSEDFTRARKGPITFIEKPFELPQFGAAVTEALDSEIPFRTIDLADVIALECVSGIDELITAQAADHSGRVYVRGGLLVHAETTSATGREALREMFRWRNANFSAAAAETAVKRTIKQPWGSVIAALLPELATQRTEEARSPEPPPKKRPRSATAKKVLVIDDTELLLDFVEEILTAVDPGLRIVTAHTGTEGLRRAQAMRPDLILLDYSLPDINGDEVCARLLDNADTARIPVVMMSGHVTEMNATAKRYRNVVDTIAKPFLSQPFVALVQKTLATGVLPEPQVVPPPSRAKNGRKPKVAESKAVPLAPAPEAKVQSPQPLPVTVVEEPPAPIEVTPLPPTLLPTVAALTSLSVEPSPPPMSPALAALPPATAVTLTEPATVLVGLAMQTIAVQITPQLRVGKIRARLSTLTVSLDFPPNSTHAALADHLGFDLERSDVTEQGQLAACRLVPTRRPVSFVKTTRRLPVATVELGLSRPAVEFTSSPSDSMAMRMMAAFRIVAVDLTAAFEVARLVLEPCSPRVRVTLNGQEPGGPGAIFQVAEVRRDEASRLAEVVLVPA